MTVDIERSLDLLVDLLGSFAFALSGAAAAKDLCLGVVPPAAISEGRYLGCAALASALTIAGGTWLARLRHPVTLFDSVGLGFFAVVGAHRALVLGAGAEAAILLGTVTAVGGGVMRDVLLNRVPAILQREIYALAALVAAVIQVVADRHHAPLVLSQCLAVGACLVLRFLALRFSWKLPVAGERP